MKGAHDKVSGLRGRHGDFNSLAVAHFAHEDDLGCLSQCGTQSCSECCEVVAQLALVKSGSLLLVNEFNRVFECDDMDRLAFIQLIQKGGKRCGFAASGCSCNKNESRLFLGYGVENRRQIELIDTWDLGRKPPEND